MIVGCIDFMEKMRTSIYLGVTLHIGNLSKTQLTAIFKEKTGYSLDDFYSAENSKRHVLISILRT